MCLGNKFSTHHRMQDETQIEELLIPLDSWHNIKHRDAPIPYVPWAEPSFLAYIKN